MKVLICSAGEFSFGITFLGLVKLGEQYDVVVDENVERGPHCAHIVVNDETAAQWVEKVLNKLGDLLQRIQGNLYKKNGKIVFCVKQGAHGITSALKEAGAEVVHYNESV